MTTENSAMPLIQSCWVVADLDVAMRGWLAMGVGPFVKFDMDFPDALYRGKTSPLAFTVALAQAGPMQIELVCQHNDGPSAYRDTIPAGGSGFHHVCRALGHYDETVAKLKEQSVELATEFVLGGARACYADTRASLGCMLEVVDDTDLGRNLISMVRDVAIGWDGRDPVRSLTLG